MLRILPIAVLKHSPYLCNTMKNNTRRFSTGFVNHCYQNTVNVGLLFYSVSGYLVMFTIICVAARRYGVRILKLCLMPDHIHGSYVAAVLKDLAAFIGYYTSEYAKLFNEICGRRGQLFNRPYGSAPKYGDKKVKSNLIYVDNNPVERHLAHKAEDYRWNFLAYAKSAHPFSEPIRRRTASSSLKKAIDMVEILHKEGRYLTFRVLHDWFSKLDKKESNQLVDYIITKYNAIDYEGSICYFGSYENELIALSSTTGSEYDIKEPFVGKNDDCYAKLSSILMKTGRYNNIYEVLGLDDDEKNDLFHFLYGKTGATRDQLRKFLHLKDLPPQSYLSDYQHFN